MRTAEMLRSTLSFLPCTQNCDLLRIFYQTTGDSPHLIAIASD